MFNCAAKYFPWVKIAKAEPKASFLLLCIGHVHVLFCCIEVLKQSTSLQNLHNFFSFEKLFSFEELTHCKKSKAESLSKVLLGFFRNSILLYV